MLVSGSQSVEGKLTVWESSYRCIDDGVEEHVKLGPQRRRRRIISDCILFTFDLRSTLIAPSELPILLLIS
jgi:hypothetical protein